MAVSKGSAAERPRLISNAMPIIQVYLKTEAASEMATFKRKKPVHQELERDPAPRRQYLGGYR